MNEWDVKHFCCLIIKEPKMQDLSVKNSQLRDVPKETESDQCQIESAIKTTNESDSQCVVRVSNINHEIL